MPSFLLYLHPTIIGIFFIGFVSGLPLALTASTLTVWLTEVGVNKSVIGLFAAVGTPYAFKFLWAPLVDRLPIPLFTRFLGRRSGWIIFSQLLLIASIMLLGVSDPSENAGRTALFALIVAIFSATQDIVVDAYRVEILKPDQQGAGGAMHVLGYRVGMLISGAGALFLAEYYSWFVVYTLMAIAISVGIITVLVLGEPEVEKKLSFLERAKEARDQKNYLQNWLKESVVSPFLDFMRKKGWWIILLFVVFFKFGDALAGAMTNSFLIEIGFSKSEIATIAKTYGFIATMIGAFIGGALVHKYGMIPSLWLGGILQMLSNLMFMLQAHIGYDTQILAITIGVENLSGGIGMSAFVAYLSSLCNISYTATQYALLSSLATAGRTWLSAGSGFMVNELGWEYFFFATTLAAIPGLILLAVMVRKEVMRREKMRMPY